MKALVCLLCSTIRSPKADGTVTHCDCGQSAIRWVDAEAGRAEMWAVDPFYTRMLGLNNAILTLPLAAHREASLTDAFWRNLHELSCKNAEGYLFHTDKRNCWAVVTRPGESSDVTFRAEPPMNPPPYPLAQEDIR